MIGRAAASNPWIFRQIAEYAERGSYATPSETDRFRMIHRYFEMLIGEEYRDAPGKMKQFASWFTHGVRGGAQLRKAIYQARGERQILAEVERFFECPLNKNEVQDSMADSTALQASAAICD
jgi:tRNA-dihydrouridine synthase